MNPKSGGTKRIQIIAEERQDDIMGIRKRPRYLTSWEESFRSMSCCQQRKQEECTTCSSTCNATNKNHRFGLVDLFGGNRWVRPRKTSVGVDANGRRRPQQHQHKSSLLLKNQGPLYYSQTERDESSSKFFTLRMEHRQGGTVAKHFGEERFLLFRSDQAGAIAKVVFSSSPVIDDSDSDSDYYKNNNHNNKQNTDDEEAKISIMANATVHVLFVKDTYRGFNLGGFLFVSCTAYLRERYCKKIDSLIVPNLLPSVIGIPSVRCRLDAEEDIRRHDKLVHFYEHLGLKKGAANKTSFINNNDGETYRRIPMKIDLFVSPEEMPGFEEKSKNNNNNHIVAAATALYPSFLPAVLISASGKRARLDDKIYDWLIVECEDGHLQLRTTDGRMLRLDQGGQCQLFPIKGASTTTTSTGLDSLFQLLRVSDMLDKVLYDKEEGCKEEQSCILQDKLLQQQQHVLAKEKELWLIRSPMHGGSFMGMTYNSNNLVFSDEASFWQADENFSLTHTYDSPARRQHHRRMWMNQSVEYVTLMRERYSTFDLHRMTIEEALNLTKYLRADPFSVSVFGRRGTGNTNTNTNNNISQQPSFRTFLFHTAELARKEGHPDWVQLVALIHGLASALTCVGSAGGSSILTARDESSNEEDDFDWTIYVDARVMGSKSSRNSTFSEFRHLNPDEGDTRYNNNTNNTRTGFYHEHIGLEKVLLSWTSSDYMYCMLKHNRVMLPKEAFAILKLFPLVDWHSRGEHTALSNDDDKELKSFVADFHDIRQRSHDDILSTSTNTNTSTSSKEMSDDECKALWANHYSLIASKYGAGDILNW